MCARVHARVCVCVRACACILGGDVSQAGFGARGTVPSLESKCVKDEGGAARRCGLEPLRASSGN